MTEALLQQPQSRFGVELEARRQEHRLRTLREASPASPGCLWLDNRELINFASNDYLGLSRHPLLKARSIEFIQKYGVGSTASRLMSGNLAVFNELETKLASLKGTESALILSTGFQTNTTALPALFGSNSTVACDRLCHNSLLQGATRGQSKWFRYNHNDMTDLREKLSWRAQPDQSSWIVTESVFGMDGDLAPLAELTAIATTYNGTIFLDEAHASGILGPAGMGFGATIPNCISMGTFGKGLGSFGAYIACTREIRDYLINFAAGIIYSTALPPAVLGAIDAALDLVPDLDGVRNEVAQKAARLRHLLRQCGFATGNSATHIIPVIVGSDSSAVSLSTYLEGAGIFAPAIRTPTVPVDQARIRLSLTAEHSQEHIDHLVKTLKGWNERKD